MFREPICNILLIYEQSTKKATISIEDAEKKSAINKYYIESGKDRSFKTFF